MAWIRAENSGIFQEKIEGLLGRAEKTIIENMGDGDRDAWDLVGENSMNIWSDDVLRKRWDMECIDL